MLFYQQWLSHNYLLNERTFPYDPVQFIISSEMLLTLPIPALIRSLSKGGSGLSPLLLQNADVWGGGGTNHHKRITLLM